MIFVGIYFVYVFVIFVSVSASACINFFFFFLKIRRPPISTQGSSSAALGIYKRTLITNPIEHFWIITFFWHFPINPNTKVSELTIQFNKKTLVPIFPAMGGWFAPPPSEIFILCITWQIYGDQKVLHNGRNFFEKCDVTLELWRHWCLI